MLCPECEAKIMSFSSSNTVEVSNGVTEFNIGRISVDACPDCYFKVEGSLNASKQTDVYISHADKLVAAYGEEIYEDKIHSLTVEELIESHRRLRDWSIKNNADNRNMRQEMQKKAYDDAYHDAINYDWVSKERLANMPMKELCELVSGL